LRTLWKGVFYSVGALFIAFLIAQLWFYSHIVYWSRYHPETTAFMESRRTKAQLQHTWVPY
jgi:monofunctional biosynthetic peptidoglycan transglycosylase